MEGKPNERRARAVRGKGRGERRQQAMRGGEWAGIFSTARVYEGVSQVGAVRQAGREMLPSSVSGHARGSRQTRLQNVWRCGASQPENVRNYPDTEPDMKVGAFGRQMRKR